MATLRATLYKLQRAMAQRGRYISISTYHIFSQRAGRAVTKYVLSEKQVTDGKQRYVTLYETWTLPGAVKYLAALYTGNDAPGEKDGHS